MNQQTSQEAIQWFVLNESGRMDNEELSERWDEWRGEPLNRAEYIRILRLVEDVRALPPPAPVPRKKLREDAAVEECC